MRLGSTSMSMRNSLRATALIAVAALVSAPLVANASSATSTINVTANVAQNCTIAALPLAFGTYDPISANLAANLDQNTTVTLTCTKGATGVTLAMGNSANDPAHCVTATTRCMVNGADVLNYQLYSDAPGGTVWTAGVAQTFPIGGHANPLAVTVYGRIPMAQDVAVAAYTDSVVATVNF